MRLGLLPFLALAGCAAAQPTPVAPVRPALPAAVAATPAEIAAVVRSQSNQASLQRCYERGLRSTGRLAGGHVEVTVSIAASGAVRRVALRAPAQLAAVEACIKLAISHWAFPANREAYGTSFPLAFRGR